MGYGFAVSKEANMEEAAKEKLLFGPNRPVPISIEFDNIRSHLRKLKDVAFVNAIQINESGASKVFPMETIMDQSMHRRFARTYSRLYMWNRISEDCWETFSSGATS
jgi:hypothetical protein